MQSPQNTKNYKQKTIYWSFAVAMTAVRGREDSNPAGNPKTD